MGYATGSTYGAGFKQEPSSPNMKTAMDDLITDHNTLCNLGSQSFTYSGTSDNSLITILTSFLQNWCNAFTNTELTIISGIVIKRRITEISNRIGYVNSKDVAGEEQHQVLNKIYSGTNKDFKDIHSMVETDTQTRFIHTQTFLQERKSSC